MPHIDSFTIVIGLLLFLLVIAGLCIIFVVNGARATASIRPVPPTDAASLAVDPWDFQRALMKSSDQPLPPLPVVSHGSILYYALILEETAETGRPLLAALQRSLADPKTHSEEIVLGKIASVISRMDESSTLIRGALKTMPNFNYTLTQREATEVLDGTTDIQVVNSGFALASGLPAQDAYVEVVSSNLSKANPKTGKIDKAPDGKWIKGVEYAEPNLEAVLHRHASQYIKRTQFDEALTDTIEDIRIAKAAGVISK